MKEFDGIKMTDAFYEYAIYKKEIGEVVNVDVVFEENGNMTAIEFPISVTEELNMLIYNLTKKLVSTDYIANKLAEANAEYIVTEDKTKLIELRNKYSKELADRETWRKEIDSLQEKLKNL